jgi:hypothetical protein
VKTRQCGKPVQQSVSAIARFAIVEPIVTDDGENFKINPSRKRYAMFREIDRFFGRIEIGHYRIYDLL